MSFIEEHKHKQKEVVMSVFRAMSWIFILLVVLGATVFIIVDIIRDRKRIKEKEKTLAALKAEKRDS